MNDNIYDQLTNMLTEAQNELRESIEDIFGDENDFVEIYERASLKEPFGQLVVNWSAIGAQTPEFAAKFAWALSVAAEIATKYNAKRAELIAKAEA